MKETLALYGGKPVRNEKIYYGHQYIDEKDIKRVVEVLQSDFLTCGPEIEKLEKKLCDVTGAKYAVAVSSGTAALHIACLAAGISEGDEVITTPITFAASANCAVYCGGKPVFADINSKTYNIDPEQIRKKINNKTKAVIGVDYTGQVVEADKIAEICKENDLYFIEDGAHSIGSKFNGRAVGTLADMTTFSFHPVKTVTGGEGGAVLTNDADLFEKLLLYRTHGITRKEELMENEPDGEWYYEQIKLGYNYRMTDIQAALINSQLDKLDIFIKRRKQIVQMYNAAFENNSGLILQEEIEESDSVRHLYVIQVNKNCLSVGRKEIYEALKAENVCCNVHYIPVYYMPFYKKMGYKKGECPNAEKLYENILSIPLYYSMTNNDVKDVIRAIEKVIMYYRKK